MTVVFDSSALITLARIGRLELLHRMVGTVHVPDAVFEEVVQKGAGRPGSAEVAQADWVLRPAEAIILAKELVADLLVIDDAAARRIAETEGQLVVGLLGLLIYAKTRGLVPEVKPLLDEMLASGFFLDESRYHSLLRRAGE